MKLSLFFFTTCLFFMLTQCKRKESSTLKVQPIYARAATYQPGSYYVFRDSVTNGLDSFYVTYFDTSSFNAFNQINETILTHFENDVNDKIVFLASTAAEGILMGESYISKNSTTGQTIYKFSFTPGKIELLPNVSNQFVAMYDTIKIDNKFYVDVYETIYKVFSTPDTIYTQKWYNLKDGLIKLRIHGNGVDKVYTTIRHLQLN